MRTQSGWLVNADSDIHSIIIASIILYALALLEYGRSWDVFSRILLLKNEYWCKYAHILVSTPFLLPSPRRCRFKLNIGMYIHMMQITLNELWISSSLLHLLPRQKIWCNAYIPKGKEITGGLWAPRFASTSTLWGRDKMTDIFQATFSNAFLEWRWFNCIKISLNY